MVIILLVGLSVVQCKDGDYPTPCRSLDGVVEGHSWQVFVGGFQHDDDGNDDRDDDGDDDDDDDGDDGAGLSVAVEKW